MLLRIRSRIPFHNDGIVLPKIYQAFEKLMLFFNVFLIGDEWDSFMRELKIPSTMEWCRMQGVTTVVSSDFVGTIVDHQGVISVPQGEMLPDFAQLFLKYHLMWSQVSSAGIDKTLILGPNEQQSSGNSLWEEGLDEFTRRFGFGRCPYCQAKMSI
jgi:hypothetical protein